MITYDKNKMTVLVQSDAYLKFVYRDLMKRNNNDEEYVLQVLFDTNVDDDETGDYWREYEKLG